MCNIGFGCCGFATCSSAPLLIDALATKIYKQSCRVRSRCVSSEAHNDARRREIYFPKPKCYYWRTRQLCAYEIDCFINGIYTFNEDPTAKQQVSNDCPTKLKRKALKVAIKQRENNRYTTKIYACNPCAVGTRGNICVERWEQKKPPRREAFFGGELLILEDQH